MDGRRPAFGKLIAQIMSTNKLVALVQLDSVCTSEGKQFAAIQVDPLVIAVVASCSKDHSSFLSSLRRHLADPWEPLPENFVTGVLSRHLGERVDRKLDNPRPGARFKNFELYPAVREQLKKLPAGLLNDCERLTMAGQRASAFFAHHS